MLYSTAPLLIIKNRSSATFYNLQGPSPNAFRLFPPQFMPQQTKTRSRAITPERVLSHSSSHPPSVARASPRCRQNLSAWPVIDSLFRSQAAAPSYSPHIPAAAACPHTNPGQSAAGSQTVWKALSASSHTFRTPASASSTPPPPQQERDHDQVQHNADHVQNDRQHPFFLLSYLLLG